MVKKNLCSTIIGSQVGMTSKPSSESVCCVHSSICPVKTAHLCVPGSAPGRSRIKNRADKNHSLSLCGLHLSRGRQAISTWTRRRKTNQERRLGGGRVLSEMIWEDLRRVLQLVAGCRAEAGPEGVAASCLIRARAEGGWAGLVQGPELFPLWSERSDF